MSVRGTKAAERTASNFARTTFFSLKDGESATIRFLTDADPTEVDGKLVGGWITVQQHQNVKTKGAPAGFTGQNWPSHMTAICRNQDLTELGIDSPKTDCFHCLAGVKKTQRTWALAVLREEVREGGRTIGFRDIKREETSKNADGSDGPVTQVPAVVVINLGHRNFFGTIEGYHTRNQTILDRDFVVTRKGATTDTIYNLIGLDTIAVDEAGTIFDLRDAKFMQKYLPTAEAEGSARASDTVLVPIIADRMSDDYYGKFFDTRVTYTQPSKDDGGGTGGVTTSVAGEAAGTVTPPPSNDVPATVDMAALRARITDHGDDSPQAEAATHAEPVAVQGRVLALD